MTSIIPPLLAGLQATVPDTVVTVLARDGLQTAADIALVVLGAFLIVLLLLLVVLMGQLRKLNRTVRSLGDKALGKADPLLERGKGVADNVEFISAAIRADVERLNETVKALSDRLRQASDHMEERIDEFNALMEVVQGEAEDLFMDTAATARGVKEGVRRLGATGGPGGEPAGADVHDEEEVLLTAPTGDPRGDVEETDESGAHPAPEIAEAAADGRGDGAASP